MNNSIPGFFVRNAAAIVVVTLSFLILSFFYGPILFHPQEHILSDTGDGIKNYYCYEWHVNNDTSMVNYSGSNYPFGEQQGYTDGNPLLSNSLRLLPFLKGYSIAIFNLSILFSYLLCALILYKIFKEFKVYDLYAVIAAIGITFLCPQVFRLSGHFTLCYNFCIPLIIYLLLKLENNPLKKHCSYLVSISILCFLFVHPYLGFMCSFFVALYWIAKSIVEGKTAKSNLFYFLLQVCLPLFLYFLYSKLTDTHSDRIVKPYGFFFYVSKIESVFISTHKPFRHFLSQIYPIRGQTSEGLAYVGITSLFCLFYLLFLAAKKRKKLRSYFREHKRARVYLLMSLSSFVLLLFSMGYPFKFGFGWLLDYLPIQQFRAPGRFAWVFYFIMTIGTTIVISKYFLAKANKTLRLILCSALLIIFFVEGFPFHGAVSKKIIAKNCFDEKYVDNELKAIISLMKEKKPQALIPLPFFHIGTEYYNIPGTEKIIRSSFVTCFHSKTPLMAGLTGRTSLTEGEDLIQVISNDLIERKIKTKIRSERPFFLLYSKELLSEEEVALLGKGDVVLESANYILKEIKPATLFANSGKQKQLYFKSQRERLVSKDGFLLENNGYFYFNGFDSSPGKQFEGDARGLTTLLQMPANTLEKDSVYELSFWYKTRDRLDLDNILSVSELDGKDTIILSSKNMKSMLNVRDQKVFATLLFKAGRPGNKIVIQLKGISDREKVFYLDDLMIRDKSSETYKVYYSGELRDSVLKINNIDVSLK